MRINKWWRFDKKAIGPDGIVGIWHNTFMVEPDQNACVYANMPEFGLGAGMKHVAAVGQREKARLLLNANKF
jgi:hypothetical protein